MAYRADIEIAVKGAQELRRLQDQVRATSKLVDGLNNYLENIGGGGVVRSIDNLNKAVADTAGAFNKAALGTDEATLAARNFVAANRQLTQGLEERLTLLKSVTEQERRQRLSTAGIRETTQYGGAIGPGPASPVGSLVGQKSPVEERIRRTLQARQDESELQQALLRLEQKSVAEANKKLESQEALIRGKREVLALSEREAARQKFLAGASATAAQGPLAGPGAMGFPVALSLSKVEQQGLATAAKKQAILQRMVATRQALVGLAANLQRLDLNSAVAIADATRNQEQLNAAKARQNRIQNAGFGIQGPALPPARGGRRGGDSNVGGAISSALIGGGFPLLFGQGPAAAAGGALGGVAGGLLGGGFGFALSIVGTALGDAVTKAEAFDKALSGLNASLSKAGSASTTTAADVKQLASNLKITNDEAVELLNTFRAFSDGDTRESLAGLFGPVGGASTLESIAKAGLDEQNALSAIFGLRQEIGNEATQQLALQLQAVGATQTQAALLDLVLKRSINITVEQAKQVTFADNLRSILENTVANLAGAVSLAIELAKRLQESSFIKLPFLDRVQEILGGVKGRTPEQIAQERANAVRKQLEAGIQDAKKAAAELTETFRVEQRVGDSLKPVKDTSREIEQTQRAILGLRNQILDAAIAQNGVEIEIERLLNGEAAALERQLLKISEVQEAKRQQLENERASALIGVKDAEQAQLINQLFNFRLGTLKQINQVEETNTKRRIQQLAVEKELQKFARQDDIRRTIRPLEQQRARTGLDIAAFTSPTEDIEQQRLALEQAFRLDEAREPILQRIRDLTLEIQNVDLDAASLQTKQDDLAAQQQKLTALEQELGLLTQLEQKQLQLQQFFATYGQLIQSVSGEIANAVTFGVSEMVRGTKTAEQVFSEFLNAVGAALLQAAQQMIAQYIAIGIARIFAGFGGGGGGGGNSATALGSNLNVAAYSGTGIGDIGIGTFGMRAMGGPVTSQRPYIVGERGPELFVPGTGGSVVNNNDLRSAMGAAPGSGGGAPVLNMSFQSTNINGVEYVSREQLEQAMAETRRNAASDGAKRGMTMTLDRIQNSSSTRRRIGV